VKRTHSTIALVLAFVLFAAPSWGRVLLRWTQPAVPATDILAVNGLVIPWGPTAVAAAKRARGLGYDVYLEVDLQQASAAVSAAQGLSGIMLDPGGTTQLAAEQAAARLRLQHPGLPILVVDRGAKQPQMRGHSVITSHGVLETSSPTEQPWLDCNLALVRYDRALYSHQAPLYQFDWDLPEPLQQQQGATAADYILAAAEAAAFRADVILSLRDDVQARLAHGEAQALTFWKQVRPYLRFAQGGPAYPAAPAEVAVIPDNDYNWFEPANLMARHNIPFQIVNPARLTSRELHQFHVLVIFVVPNKDAANNILEFASRGGVAVLVDAKGAYPWHSEKATRENNATATYLLHKGRIMELLKPVDDPDTFASDIRRLLAKRMPSISLWNAWTTIAVPYRRPGSADMVVELVNYAQDPLSVQAQVKGRFGSIRYESPQDGCCRDLKAVQENGFTQFVVPNLATAGRVYLRASQQGEAERRASSQAW
jgi:hypothetical protein